MWIAGETDGGAAGQVGDAEVSAVFVAGKADGSDEGGSLVDQNTEDKQMHGDRRGGILRVAREGCDRFAYCFDVCALLMPVYECLLKQDRGRLLLIHNVI